MEKIGGYRLVRKLGEGERAEIWLGHAGRGQDGIAAIKVYRAETDGVGIQTELQALARASSPHLLALLDVGTAPDGRPCLVLRRLPGPSLARLIARRQDFAVGELVTAMTPIVGAVAELHRTGVAHGGIDLSSVLLDGTGAPVLARFGRARLVGPPQADDGAQGLTNAQRAEEPLLVADLDRVATIVRSVLGRMPTGSRRVAELAEWLDATGRPDDFLEVLSDRLFDLAPAVPLRTEERSTGAVPALPGRPVPVSVPVAAAPKGRASRRSALTGLGRWIDENVAPTVDSSPVAAVVGRLMAAARTVRRPVWIAGVAGLVALVISVAVIASAGGKDAAAPDPSPSGPATGVAARPSDGAIVGDDPVAAARALIAARADCLLQRSVGCLAKVDQAGSAASEADEYFLRQLQGGGTVKDRRLDAREASLVERLGDSAIVGLGAATAPSTYPASVLVVKVDAGWRIRDLTTGASP